MNELFNFHDTWIVAQANWVWLLIALGLGIWIGWISCTSDGNA
jgi:hypothetical protein